MLERWTAAVLRFRALVLLIWLGVLLAGVWAAPRLPPLLSDSFAVPGTESERARTILGRNFGERPDGAFVVVFDVVRTSDRAERKRVQRRLRLAARAVPTGHAGTLRAGGGILYGNVETTLDLQHAKRHTEAVRRALQAPGGAPAYVTGQPAIQSDLDRVFSADLRRGQAIALPVALLALLAVFGLSLVVAIPFVFAACTIAGTLGVVWMLAHVLSMVTYVTNLVELIGLALAIDYSLLIVHRFREELGRGLAVEDAVVRTMATAGRSVLFSGLAVAAGLAVLLLMPVPFLRSMGVGGLLIPLASIAAALTLQPALLSLLGRRVGSRAPFGGRNGDGGLWARLARAIMRRPVTFLAGGTAVLLAAAVPALFLKLSPGSFSSISSTQPSLVGLGLLRDGVGAGAVAPTHVVVDTGAPGRASAPVTRAAVDRLGDRLVLDPEALIVASGSRTPYVDASRRYTRVIVAGRHEYGEEESRRFVVRLRRDLVPAAGFPEGTRVYAGGAPPQGVDFLDRAYGAFPWLVLGILVLTYLVLVRAFRSLVLPLKAVLLNLLTTAAVYGLLVAVLQWGNAEAFGIEQTSQIEGWIPIFLFAILFGLSMDYEVFLVTRMREVWDETGDNARAVAAGLERTGRIITAAALIMAAAFCGFLAGSVTGLKQLGLALALGVVIDATLVRAVLVPAMMAVLGRYNWWLPTPVARLFRVAPSRRG
ncbi:MAG: MMPL family transporter, partial [Gaiellaceae bacterium]